MMKTLKNKTGSLHIESLRDGTLQLTAQPSERKHGPLTCKTRYSMEFIEAVFRQSGAGWTCDEILRDTDANDAQLDVKLSVQAYFSDAIFNARVRILDYGCGGGSSTAVLARLFPNAQIVAADFDSGLLNTARLRRAHYGYDVDIRQVSELGELSVGDFDLVFLNAVYEHLMPEERAPVMRNVLAALKPGGSLILNQTPHAGFPVDAHTTGIPLLNYLPQSIAQRLANRKSGHPDSWATLLRAGIRGGTVHEIMGHVLVNDPAAQLRKPIRIAHCWSGIWYAAKQQRSASALKRTIICVIGAVVDRLRLPVSPYINIAVTRGPF